MAYSLNGEDPVPIGTLVYEIYSPAKCGKVIEDRGFSLSGNYFRKLLVRWLKDGNES